MADKPEARPEKVTGLPVSDPPHAPFIFYEIARAFGFTNGVVNITLSANRTYAGSNGVVIIEQVVVAYRRQARMNLLFPGKYPEVPQGGAVYVFAVK
jgi:hypothetical protein